MKIVYQVLTYLGTIMILNLLANWFFVSKNNGEKYIDNYISCSREVKIKVNPDFFEGQNSHTSFFKYTILFKGIYGNSGDFIFKDDLNNKFFKIMRFDYYDDKFGLPQSTSLDNEELYVKVDPLQYNNPAFGTKENPIPIFSYKGVNKQLMTEIRTDEKGEDGRYINKSIPLSPTEEEYHYNVEQYLTYVMPKEEFKKRFK
ncbi:cytochrome c oxidase subunit Vb family protein [Chryseobacterium turcicum]|uniref:DUF8188 domain-containing protein n=1 Tax=Chryseobacterium turcicum TaxID=2898076 RepID=A0A9Q3YWV9_9FLAO|nr:hypothetical protein [Chryseobacterium turcicum]MCD1116412.1 hypothetical protein [Chryseobacterium turcicum]